MNEQKGGFPSKDEQEQVFKGMPYYKQTLPPDMEPAVGEQVGWLNEQLGEEGQRLAEAVNGVYSFDWGVGPEVTDLQNKFNQKRDRTIALGCLKYPEIAAWNLAELRSFRTDMAVKLENPTIKQTVEGQLAKIDQLIPLLEDLANRKNS